MAASGTAIWLLAGDVMTGRGVDQALRDSCPPAIDERYVRDAREYLRAAERRHGPVGAPLAAHEPWGDALGVFRDARVDARIVNLETAVTCDGSPWPGKGIHYRMHPGNVDVLAAARINACALANNHVLDWGRGGLADTLGSLQAAGIATAGAGVDRDAAWRPAVLGGTAGPRTLVLSLATTDSGVMPDWAATDGRSGVALLPDLSPASARAVAETVARHRRAGDLVIVSIHWGDNWVPEVPPAHRGFARRLIDLGAADVLHGHSSHHPLPVEVYRDRLILYGCGDLINDYEGIGDHGPWPNDLGALFRVTVDRDDHRLRRLDVLPLQRRRLRLRRADAGAADTLRRLMQIDAAAGWRESADGGWSLEPRR